MKRLIFLFSIFLISVSCTKDVKKTSVIKEKSLDLQVKEAYLEGVKALEEGDVLNIVADYAQDKPWAGASRDLAPISLIKELTDLQKRASNTKDEEKKAELTRRLYSRAAEIGLRLTTKQSIPIYNLTKWAKNVDQLSKPGEDEGKAFLRLFNYSEYQISGGPKGKKVKPVKRGEGGSRGSSDRGSGGNRGKSNRGAGGNRGE